MGRLMHKCFGNNFRRRCRRKNEALINYACLKRAFKACRSIRQQVHPHTIEIVNDAQILQRVIVLEMRPSASSTRRKMGSASAPLRVPTQSPSMYRFLHKRSTNLSAMLGRDVGNFGKRLRQSVIPLASPALIVTHGIRVV